MESGLIEFLGELFLGLFDWLFPQSGLLRVIAWLAALAMVIGLIWLAMR